MDKKAKHDEKGGRIIGRYNNYHPAEFGKPEHYELSSVNVDDLTTVIDMSIQALQRGTVKYENTSEGLEKLKTAAIEYFRYINEANSREDVETRVYPDVEGLCMFLGISRKRLFDYERERSEEWAEAISIIKTAISTAKKQLSSTFKIPPVLAIFDLANNHGYKNVSEFKIEATDNTKREVERQTTEQIAEGYGLTWNDEEGRWM